MKGGRPRTPIGGYGEIYVMHRKGRCVAEARYRDIDGRLREITATAGSVRAASARLKERIASRPGHTVGNLSTRRAPSRPA